MNQAKQVFVFLFAGLGALLTGLPLLPSQQWWVRMWDFPRVQLLCWCLLSLILTVSVLRPWKAKERVLVIFTVLCLGYQAICIAPYTLICSTQVKMSERDNPNRQLRVLTANVLMSNRDADRVMAQVKEEEPDLVLLTETDTWWVAAFEEQNSDFPYSVLQPQSNTYGMALFSKYPLEKSEVFFLSESDIPSIHTDVKLPSGEFVRFIGLHPRPPAPQEAKDTVERDAELVMVGRLVQENFVPTIVAGDLNDVAWSETTTLFRQISGTLDPRIGRGLYNSFHADYAFLRFPLDHVFHTPDFRLKELRRLSHVGSDHFPIIIELSLESDAEIEHPQPKPTQEDEEKAKEILQEAK